MGTAQLMIDLQQWQDKSLQIVCKELDESHHSILEQTAQSLQRLVMELLQSHEELEPCFQLPVVKYVHISMLRTSLLDETPLYRVDLYDEKKFACLQEHFAYWPLSFASGVITRWKQELAELFQYRQKEEQRYYFSVLVATVEQLHQILCERLFAQAIALCAEVWEHWGLEQQNICVGEFLCESKEGEAC